MNPLRSQAIRESKNETEYLQAASPSVFEEKTTLPEEIVELQRETAVVKQQQNL